VSQFFRLSFDVEQRDEPDECDGVRRPDVGMCRKSAYRFFPQVVRVPDVPENRMGM